MAAKKPARRKLAGARRPPRSLTRDQYLVWRAPRLVRGNPTRVRSPVWEWIARHPELSAWEINEHFDGPSSLEAGAAFCCMRYGQSRTPLPDGRVLAVGGEHEDWYDPDFFVYNDVIVEHPSGEREVWGYPVDAFPPTDHHSATLDGDRVLLVGGLSYPERRRPGATPVWALDVATLAVSPVATVGTPPGWLSKHRADLADDGRVLVVEGGELIVVVDGEQTLVEHPAAWALELASMRWSCTRTAAWEQWEVGRADRRSHRLWVLEQLGRHGDDSDRRAELREWFDGPPDLPLFASLYVPPVPHDALPPTRSGRWPPGSGSTA